METDFHQLTYIASVILQLIIFIVGAYFFSISVFGWIKRKEESADSYAPTKKFALVVAAHNEERVIEQMIESLNHLNYPKELYDIFIVADNCTDNTASLAREKGAIVYERFNTMKRGKGYAMEWIFEIIFKLETNYDAISVFDADNVVSPNFLLEMNKQLCKGYKVVQGYIDTKNPFDSWITVSYAIAFWTVNRLFQLSRYYAGMTCSLCGTGFSIDTEVLKKLGWGATCLTEDLEFTMKLALNDMKVAWCHDAIVYDEKPLTMKQSWNQRVRWMQGQADCAFRFLPSMMVKAFKERNLVAFDCAIYLLQPLRIIFMGLVTLMAYLQWFYPKGTFFQMDYLIPTYVWTVFVVSQLLYGPLIVAAEKKFNYKVLLGFLIYPIYSLTWIPITIQGFIYKDSKEWSHTLHTRQIAISELEEVKQNI